MMWDNYDVKYLCDTGVPIYISDLQYDIGGVLFDIGAPIYYIGCAVYK